MGCPIPADQHILGFAGVAFTSDTPAYAKDGEIGTRPIVAVPRERADDVLFEKFLVETASTILADQVSSEEIGLIINTGSSPVE